MTARDRLARPGPHQIPSCGGPGHDDRAPDHGQKQDPGAWDIAHKGLTIERPLQKQIHASELDAICSTGLTPIPANISCKVNKSERIGS